MKDDNYKQLMPLQGKKVNWPCQVT